MTTLDTEQTVTISPDAAAARLRLRGFTVRPHGINWLVLQPPHDRRLTLSAEDLSLAARLAQSADDFLTIDELLARLESAVGVEAPVAAVVLSDQLQEYARRYVAARRRSGDALLEAVAELAAARAAARHGEWEIFLQAVGLDESRARAQLRIHEEAERDPRIAELIRTGWLTEAVARELLPAPAEVRESILTQEEAPSLREVREAKRASTPVLEPPALSPIDTLTANMAQALEDEFGIPVEVEVIGEVQPPPAPLPAAPPGWIIYRNDDRIVVEHECGLRLPGTDAAALVGEAERAEMWAAELAADNWRVSYDPNCAPELHAFVATHEHNPVIAAHDLPHLALLAWRARFFEDDLPDWPDELIDALYLAGEDPIELAGHDLSEGELYYRAGLRQPTTTTTTTAAPTQGDDPGPHLPPKAEYKAAQERAALLGLRIDMNAHGAFGFYRLADASAAGGAVDWASALELLGRKEAANFTALCERAESLGATIDYSAYSDPELVKVVPPQGYQQRPLRCNAADLAFQIAAWEGTPNDQPAESLETRTARAISQARHLIGLLDANNWAGAQHTCKLLARTMGIEI